jgi:hypothetical protein
MARRFSGLLDAPDFCRQPPPECVRPLSITVNAYMRLTESSVRFYERGRLLTRHAWTTSTRIELGALNDAATSFEASFTNIYRATSSFMIQIRKSRLLDEAFRRGLGKPSFISSVGEIRNLRRRIHHLDADILAGKIANRKTELPSERRRRLSKKWERREGHQQIANRRHPGFVRKNSEMARRNVRSRNIYRVISLVTPRGTVGR